VSAEMRVVTLGVHVVDVLARPVQEIPEGQGGQLVETIRITAAGPAGGTALTLAKLGGVGCVAATRGADGVLILDAEDERAVPAFQVDVVDTTGCGDAFSAGFLRGLSLGRDHEQAATLGCACAALVAGGLGSDHGAFDLSAADAFAAQTPTRSPVAP
jgi:sugar/nucleoside kinase (ribokinase family)